MHKGIRTRERKRQLSNYIPLFCLLPYDSPSPKQFLLFSQDKLYVVFVFSWSYIPMFRGVAPSAVFTLAVQHLPPIICCFWGMLFSQMLLTTFAVSLFAVTPNAAGYICSCTFAVFDWCSSPHLQLPHLLLTSFAVYIFAAVNLQFTWISTFAAPHQQFIYKMHFKNFTEEIQKTK